MHARFSILSSLPRLVVVPGFAAFTLAGCATSTSISPAGPAPHAVLNPVSAPAPRASAESHPQDTLAVEHDGTVIFQRAFWRRPATERVLHAERREWANATQGVTRWAWFIAIEAGPTFRQWLLDENPFGLTPASSAAIQSAATLPDWFPAANAAREFKAYSTREGRFLVLVDARRERIFAMDSGLGFAAPVSPRTAQNSPAFAGGNRP